MDKVDYFEFLVEFVDGTNYSMNATAGIAGYRTKQYPNGKPIKKVTTITHLENGEEIHHQESHWLYTNPRVKTIHVYDREEMREMYIHWFNNFLTIGRFASYYGITDKFAVQVLKIGKESLNNQLFEKEFVKVKEVTMNVMELSEEEFKQKLSELVRPEDLYINAGHIYEFLINTFKQPCSDSVLREWAFQWWAEISDNSYSLIYNRWLNEE